MAETALQPDAGSQQMLTLMTDVFVPSFLQKMAERGYPVTSEDDAREMITTAAKLRVLAASQPQASPTALYKSASAALDNVLKQVGAAQAEPVPLPAVSANSLKAAEALAATVN